MNRILALYIFLLLCGTVSAQQIVEWSDLQTITDNSRRTVYYKKGRKQPLRGKYRIIRGLDEECVKFSDGMINGDYRRYRDGVLRESGIYAKGKRNSTFTEYILHRMLTVIHIQRHQLENILDHLSGGVALGLDADASRRFGDGWIEVVRNDDQIPMPHISQCF